MQGKVKIMDGEILMEWINEKLHIEFSTKNSGKLIIKLSNRFAGILWIFAN